MKSRKNQYSSNSPNDKDLISQKGERVLVYVRIRPFNEDELLKDSSTPIEFVDTKNNAMICNSNKFNNLTINIISKFLIYS